MAAARGSVSPIPEGDRPSDPKQLPRFAQSAHALNALVHLYRAEVGRLTAYRQRLDTSTSWAISASALVVTISFGSAGLSHASFVFLMFLVYFFLHLEARRFRYYEKSRYRVQILERFFYPEVLGHHDETDPHWEELLLDALEHTRDRPGRLAAVGWRLRRTYFGIYVAVLLAWVVKLNMNGGTTWDLAGLVDRASVGSIPGWLFVGVVLLFYLYLGLATALARRLYPEGDDFAREGEAFVGDPG